MKRMLKFLKGHKKESILAPLFKMLEALFELFVPLVVAEIIGSGIGGGDGSVVTRMCALLLAELPSAMIQNLPCRSALMKWALCHRTLWLLWPAPRRNEHDSRSSHDIFAACAHNFGT